MTKQSAIYRIYFAPKALLERMLRWCPWLKGPVERAKAWIRERLLPRGDEWVQVRAGLGQGAWMRLRFPEEAGVWRGEHEPDVQEALEAVLRPGWVVFDVGAAIGSVALGAAMRVGDAGCVVAFEADPEQVERLREHVRRNDLDPRVRVVHAAVWSDASQETIPFRCGRHMRTQGGVEFGAMRPILGDGELIRVPVTTLDAFVASGGPAPQLIKIDVEGAEAEVLRGGERVFTEHRPLIVAEIHTAEARDAVRAWMHEYNYASREVMLYDPAPIRLFAWPGETQAP